MRIWRDGITSAEQLPSGTIVKTTNTESVSGYNTATKDAFETDGSLIAVFAPKAASKDAYNREVKIKWKTGGKFVTYTFDLTLATLEGEVPPTPPTPTGGNGVLTRSGKKVYTENGKRVVIEG